ncbi:class I SAM-dependent methyltransferase [Paucisalibacillus globulus]|uniref:class I SAM-dependent methyltransferase n=1 Tax=Paucisalibacillus globulus TaxID=351095 RepID=UPI0003F53EA4|nr:class I SAM-dependent methyltransferase [Paucisalibacillus globulus]
MGREFLEIFENWAEDYDKSVAGMDPEYKEVFRDYNNILQEVTNNSFGNILEFGVGTGNLTAKFLERGHRVIGIEPSSAMRGVTKAKLPETIILDGDFLHYPKLDLPINTVVSTYAFHHLTDVEKESAVKNFSRVLATGGKVVFADTMFVSEQKMQQKINEADEAGFTNLAEDLRREYYPLTETIERIFITNNFTIEFKQMNEFVWLIIAKKLHE